VREEIPTYLGDSDIQERVDSLFKHIELLLKY
jgi:hypothetical protein